MAQVKAHEDGLLGDFNNQVARQQETLQQAWEEHREVFFPVQATASRSSTMLLVSHAHRKLALAVPAILQFCSLAVLLTPQSFMNGLSAKLEVQLQGPHTTPYHALSLPPHSLPHSIPHTLPHSLPHSLPLSIPHSRRRCIKQKHCLETTQCFLLFQKIAGRNGVQFQIAIPGRKSYKRR